MIRKDTLWKSIIEDLIEDFIQFFYSEYVHQIDFGRGIVPLDKELEEISQGSGSGTRYVDKLFKVFEKGGDERWFLIHVEVQGYSDQHFPKRMFQYAYRLKDKYHKSLTALVIYTHENRKSHFSVYEESFLGTKLRYEFGIFVLADHSPEELRKLNNLFGFVLEVARQDQICRKFNDENRLETKKVLIRHLLNQGIKKAKIRKLLIFIQYYINFDQTEYYLKFEKEMKLVMKSRKAMGIEESVLKEVEEAGYSKGEEVGFSKGLEESTRRVVIRAWKKEIPPSEIAELVGTSIEVVEQMILDFGNNSLIADEEE